MSQTDWEDERAADLHDRMLRHGEMHLDGPGEWIGEWWFPIGVQSGRDAKLVLDNQGDSNQSDCRALEEDQQDRGGHGCGRTATGAGQGGSIAHYEGRNDPARSPRDWRDILWRIIRRKRGG